MILSNLSEIMGKRKLKMSKIISDTGISRPTLTALYYNYGKGINFDTLNSLCNYFDLQPGDFFTFYDLEILGIEINYDTNCTGDVIVTKDGTKEEVISDIYFSGSISLSKKASVNSVKYTFSGYLDVISYENYGLHMSWNCTRENYFNIAPNDALEYMDNQIIETLIDKFPGGNMTISSCVYDYQE